MLTKSVPWLIVTRNRVPKRVWAISSRGVGRTGPNECTLCGARHNTTTYVRSCGTHVGRTTVWRRTRANVWNGRGVRLIYRIYSYVWRGSCARPRSLECGSWLVTKIRPSATTTSCIKRGYIRNDTRVVEGVHYIIILLYDTSSPRTLRSCTNPLVLRITSLYYKTVIYFMSSTTVHTHTREHSLIRSNSAVESGGCERIEKNK